MTITDNHDDSFFFDDAPPTVLGAGYILMNTGRDNRLDILAMGVIPMGIPADQLVRSGWFSESFLLFFLTAIL
jgi:hypothetical protein